MKRVLALVPGGIGDQILFFPTLDDLKQQIPDVRIDVVTEPRSVGAYRLCKSVTQVIPFDFKANNSLADWGNLLGVIREVEYDTVFSLGKRFAVGLLLWLTGIRQRVGYSGDGQLFLTDSVPLNLDQYAAQMYHDLLKGLGINTPCPEISISVPKKDIEWAESEQERLAIKDSGYVLIHGGSSQLAKEKGINKIYPVENWVKIITDFRSRQPDLPVVVVQGPEDGSLVNDLRRALSDLKITAPPDLGKLAAMIAGANLMLCTDSAPMHLAVAVQTYTLALFGPTDPAKLLPKSEKFLPIRAESGLISDIPPSSILERVWGS
ncbi:glycosyltransferase family 9 protein [Leptolyngbya sp. FACHB-261]|uniref:glycosyltransferase family 9 protein n=1 Tax=Leptolyngbya sp. FACHB-261 TaxID=2692806 RepID=UPI001682ED2F|nr:glycosyltransferase family 9 protein [Leptolyngbya sp. FACHB-261]MBD2104516.1 glycosyltransferase family 9 protein [Leptolyngbya sp. FACHB-261]